jgi:hypothetical protein
MTEMGGERTTLAGSGYQHKREKETLQLGAGGHH